MRKLTQFLSKNGFLWHRSQLWMTLSLGLLLLSGCGFHLRGFAVAHEIPDWLYPIAVVTNTSDRALGPLLSSQLQAYHVIVAPTKEQAKYWLVIENDNLQQQITNVSASTTPRQYLLIYTVRFSLVSKDGVVVIPSSVVSINRQFTLNNNRILGSNFEEMTFKREMQREAANQIIGRVSAAHPVTTN